MTNPRRQAVNPNGVAAPIRGYYSNSVKVSAGPLLFIAGQIPIDIDGNLVGKGDVAAQAEQVLKNIETIVKANGATMADIVKVTAYVTDINSLDKIAPVRLRYFPKDGPASVLVEVSRLVEPDIMLEMDAIVAVP
jgi:2-iminobutanoate/2-iminopropanoate deaminase